MTASSTTLDLSGFPTVPCPALRYIHLTPHQHRKTILTLAESNFFLGILNQLLYPGFLGTLWGPCCILHFDLLGLNTYQGLPAFPVFSGVSLPNRRLWWSMDTFRGACCIHRLRQAVYYSTSRIFL
jgi:hypothetical protein